MAGRQLLHLPDKSCSAGFLYAVVHMEGGQVFPPISYRLLWPRPPEGKYYSNKSAEFGMRNLECGRERIMKGSS